MNVIAKVETAQQKATFRHHYDYICKQNNTNPLQNVTAALRQNKLDIVGDRIKLDDWCQIVKALRYDKSLQMIAIRSRFPCSTIIDVVDEKRAKGVKKLPVLFTRYVMGGLVSAINECLASTDACTYLELEGLPLRREFLDHLLDGVGKCASLQKLSLYRSNIGDQGVAVVCQALKDMPHVRELDLTGCGVTKGGAGMVAGLLKYQSLQRWGEGWKQSLRYRVPDVDSFPGIRRITLNHNSQLSDHGLRPIMDTLKDDIFLRALDLQGCGLTNDAAIIIINTLRVNRELVVVDARVNELISRSLLTRIMQALAKNQGCCAGNNYSWLDLGKVLNPRKAAASKSSLVVRPDTAPPTRHAFLLKKRTLTADTTPAARASLRPQTCVAGKIVAVRAPRQSPRSPVAGSTATSGVEAKVEVKEEEVTTQTSPSPPPVVFEADRLREDCQLLSLELRGELDKRQCAESAHEQVRSEMTALRTQLDQERAQRLEAEAVMQDLLRAVKKANAVNVGLRQQRDAAIIAAMEPGHHKLYEEFVPEDTTASGERRPNSRRRRSPNKLKKWSRRIEMPVAVRDPTDAANDAGDAATVDVVTKPRLAKSQLVFLQLDQQALGNDLWSGE